MANEYDLKPTFPIAGVAELIASRPAKEYQARAVQAEQLMQGIQLFGKGVDSLVARRNAMAQALAQAQIYAQTPEGQQAMAPTQAPTPGYGAQMPAGAEGPAGPTTSTPSPINMQTLATAFRGESPGTFLSNLQAQATNKRAYDLEALKESNTQALATKRLQAMKEIFKGGLGAKYAGIGQQDTSNLQNNISSLQQKKDELIKQLPGTFGTYMGNDKAKAARDEISKIDIQIADYQKQLIDAGKSSQDAKHSSTADLWAIVNGL